MSGEPPPPATGTPSPSLLLELAIVMARAAARRDAMAERTANCHQKSDGASSIQAMEKAS